MRSLGSSGRCVSSSKRLRASLVLWKRRRGPSICRACSTKTTPMTSSGSSEPPTTSPSSARAPDVRETLSRSEEHTSELQSQSNLVCRLLLEKKKKTKDNLTCEQRGYHRALSHLAGTT